jgi:hypothetical protein
VAGLVGLVLAVLLYSHLLNWTVTYSNDHLEEIASALEA